MTPPTAEIPDGAGRPLDPRTIRSRQAALAAVRELLTESGLPGVTHVTVAARSGVGRSTLYRHWPDVPSMVSEALAQVRVAATPVPTGHLRTDLVNLLNGTRMVLHHPASERAMRALIERSGIDPAYTELKRQLHRSGAAVIEEFLNAGIARGDLSADLDLDLAVAQLAGPVFYDRLLADRDVPPATVEKIVDAWLTLYAPQESPSHGRPSR
ncbi:TetR/AcrR family transcriptional regulator C-terminal ligand-binding domain-containing protein [Spirillospora sp. CA-294931]|uniref:TetR/AcrR family transcriptional regulator n=1 Tax=Spirillospora sp. CA-294931 TaxID=3240042 RepID=UPI003D8D3729